MKKSNPFTYFLLLLAPYFSIGQNFLKLDDCSFVEYEINDHQDSDNDGDVCEAKLILSKTAYYTEDEPCDLSMIKWNVKVDLWKDGTFDLEYSSELPPSDNTLDDTNGNGIPDLYIPRTSNNEEQTINLPDIGGEFSSHEVTWLVSDDCDLGDLCKASFSVEDNKAPTPYCAPGFTMIFEPSFGNSVMIYAEDYNFSSFDNCTPQEELRFSFSGDEIIETREVTCDDVINSPVDIDIYVWDERGNVDYCTTVLTLIPGPTVDCYPNITIIDGNVKNWRGDPMEGVEILLEANLPEFPMTRITDAEGNYSFGMHPSGIEYTISASLEDSYNSGLSTLDLVLIQLHILSLMDFDNPYRIIAGDVNGDRKASAADLVMLRKLILGIISEFPDTPVWQFIDADFEFTDPMHPFTDLSDFNAVPYKIVVDGSMVPGHDFIGLKTGDTSN